MSEPVAPLGTRLLYARVWEDLAVAREALRIQPGATVIAVAAAGDNALGLLLDDPARVIAVDVNPAQVALADLKRAAVAHLPPPSVERFLGAVPAAPRERLALFEQVRPHLKPASASFWARHRSTIAAGVVHQGRFERYLALFRALLAVVPGRAVVRAMLAAPTLDDQVAIYTRRWNTPAWRALVAAFFSRPALARFGRHRRFFDHAAHTGIGRHYRERAAFGLTGLPIRTNPYAGAMLERHVHPLRRPAYLEPACLPTIAARAERLQLRTESLDAALDRLPDHSVDAFYLSDVFEAASSEQHAATLVRVARVGRPGARLCYWNNLVHRERPDHLADRLARHPDLASDLHCRDRGFLYSRVVVEEVR